MISLDLPLNPVMSSFSNSERLKILEISSSNPADDTTTSGVTAVSPSEFDEPSNIITSSVTSSIASFASDKCSFGSNPVVNFTYSVSWRYAKSISKLDNWVATLS